MKPTEKPTIKKIVFNVRGKSLELSMDEAKELKSILSEMFGGTQYVERWHNWPWQYWSSTPTIAGTYTGNITNCASQTTDTLYLNAGSLTA